MFTDRYLCCFAADENYGAKLACAFVGMGTSNTAAVNLTRPLGLEFEMLCPVTEAKSRHEFQIALARILSANGLPAVARGYSTLPVPRKFVAAVEFDESVIPPATYRSINWANLEVKTKKLAGLNEFDQIVPRLLDICLFLNCRALASTGLHVTLGVAEEATRPAFVPSLTKLMWRFEPVLFGLVDPRRSTCGYARPLPDLAWLWKQPLNNQSRLALLTTLTRHHGVNLQRLLWPERPGDERIEFRWHEGTLDIEAVRHWVVLLNRLTQHAATHRCKTPACQTRNDRGGLENLFTTIGLKSNSRLYTQVSPELVKTRRYLLRRWRRLSQYRLSE